MTFLDPALNSTSVGPPSEGLMDTTLVLLMVRKWK